MGTKVFLSDMAQHHVDEVKRMEEAGGRPEMSDAKVANWLIGLGFASLKAAQLELALKKKVSR